VWQGFLGSNNTEFGKNIASSRMTYGRFLEYLDMGWVKRVDLYDDGHTAIVEAIGPELGNRIQRIRVELPATAPELITKLRKANVDIDAHPSVDGNSSWGILGNLIFPIALIGGLAFLFRRSSNMPGGPGQAMNFGKSKARFQMEAKTGVTFADAVGRQRGTGIGGGNDEREQTLNQLLTEMDGFEGNTGIIVIAATNRVDVLDSALLRPGRFDRQVTVDVPDVKGRLEILNVHARNKKLADEVSLAVIAKRTPGFSGADLANLLNEAAILTARRRKDATTMSEVDAAIDRVIAGMEGTALVDSKTKRLIAYHEVGHAIVGTLLKHHDAVQKVTLIPRGQAKGLTWFTPSDDQSLISRSQILARIMGALGGRAAEEVVFGYPEVTTGAGNDLQQVTSMARQMVTRFGMSNIGPLALESQGSDPFLGRSMGGSSQYSEDVASRIDMQIRSIIQHCHDETIQIIKDNRVVIDQLVDILIEKETISGEEFRSIVAEYTPLPEKTIYKSQL
jgi:ATP-dependent Zn protease